MNQLDTELNFLSYKHRKAGFAVRLHILGDFPNLEYLRRWAEWSDDYPALHIWGYTAHRPNTPIGRAIDMANEARPDRWRIRFSVPESAPRAPRQVTTTWDKPRTLDYDPSTQSMVCPQEIGRVNHCATCGICWNPKLDHKRVVFLGHG